ncbi:hypothetical protein ABT168_02160 [Streptomyces sp. NPDC001793]|uniref:hypothetical protein n=1 Tax=Streptomyces sp. NPDC001793 TaxID=3154657 RepID=UPI00332EB43E
MTPFAFETAEPDPVSYLDRLATSGLGRSCKQRMLDERELRAGRSVVEWRRSIPAIGSKTGLPPAASARTCSGVNAEAITVQGESCSTEGRSRGRVAVANG